MNTKEKYGLFKKGLHYFKVKNAPNPVLLHCPGKDILEQMSCIRCLQSKSATGLGMQSKSF